MRKIHVKYLLVGGGLASSTAAGAIRRRDAEGSIMLVGQEVVRPYHRPQLSKDYLRREENREKIFINSEKWFDEQRIELRTGRRAAYLDTARRSVTLDDGLEVGFDKLLLATGGTAAPLKVPGSDLPNLYYLRTLADVDRLHHALDTARSGGSPHRGGRGRVCVIGGGLLGVELSASLARMGLSVDLVVHAGYPWHRFAGEGTGSMLNRYLESHGISLHVRQRPQRLEGDGRVQRVILNSGAAVACDLAIAAVGMTPNKDLLRGTSIAAARGILVDAYCETSEAGIYAAGDCAAVYDPLFDKHRRIDHWDSARVCGELAGANMAGERVAYSGVNYFFSDVFGLSLSAWGEARLVDRRVIRGSVNVERPDFVEIGIAQDGRVCQVLAVGHSNEDELLRELVARRLTVDGNEEQLRDPDFDLERLL